MSGILHPPTRVAYVFCCVSRFGTREMPMTGHTFWWTHSNSRPFSKYTDTVLGGLELETSLKNESSPFLWVCPPSVSAPGIFARLSCRSSTLAYDLLVDPTQMKITIKKQQHNHADRRSSSFTFFLLHETITGKKIVVSIVLLCTVCYSQPSNLQSFAIALIDEVSAPTAK